MAQQLHHGKLSQHTDSNTFSSTRTKQLINCIAEPSARQLKPLEYVTPAILCTASICCTFSTLSRRTLLHSPAAAPKVPLAPPPLQTVFEHVAPYSRKGDTNWDKPPRTQAAEDLGISTCIRTVLLIPLHVSAPRIRTGQQHHQQHLSKDPKHTL